jgi:hypothetical protein
MILTLSRILSLLKGSGRIEFLSDDCRLKAGGADFNQQLTIINHRFPIADSAILRRAVDPKLSTAK